MQNNRIKINLIALRCKRQSFHLQLVCTKQWVRLRNCRYPNHSFVINIADRRRRAASELYTSVIGNTCMVPVKYPYVRHVYIIWSSNIYAYFFSHRICTEGTVMVDFSFNKLCAGILSFSPYNTNILGCKLCDAKVGNDRRFHVQ